MGESPLHVWLEQGEQLLRLRLFRPKANIIDAAMIAALKDAFDKNLSNARLRAVLLDAEGPHFSFGASVEEHLPEACAEMLSAMHSLIWQMLEYEVPILVAIHGQCLGGGLEVAAAGHMIFAAPNASLGQPEVRLGVFASPASCLLPEKIGQSRAEDLLLSGRSIDAEEAYRIGLVNQVAEDPQQAALDYFQEFLAPLSASTVKFAVRAARITVNERIKIKLDAVKKMYLEELMAGHDAVEGLNAFLEKRPAVWEDR
ncbi:cyclohexa-1,5-diene-1-carbonyl-CoA hydratase [Syntrophus gentianae]|uniref:Cyclohexa-1,5-diene-1-carbonyl-CoA hydratase n=1 Tax=Syntrophus gentianae TaxID=43775 RepID=A0A1H7ZN18_9BACT|nr:cyclohexa-1,5-dienecarbonyl-CoA hydratase [Syntrophus gentianae]SEM59334.1 cyclohexa-1,5-diene-1-carbonyl-CoA hydratase [Syntrophus gentianae]